MPSVTPMPQLSVMHIQPLPCALLLFNNAPATPPQPKSKMIAVQMSSAKNVLMFNPFIICNKINCATIH